MTKNFVTAFTILTLFSSCGNTETTTASGTDSTNTTVTRPVIQEDSVSYTAGTAKLKSYVYFDASKEGKRPVVLVVPEWWGLNEYPRTKARQLAELGYLAVAVDMYGDGKLAANPTEAQTLATPFYTNPQLAADHIAAATQKVLSYQQADANNVAAIGYCFGGTAVLNAARLGADLKGVVSFHGDFPNAAPLVKLKFKAAVLIAHGDADDFVPQASLQSFVRKLDSAGVQHIVKTYPGATHAFTNPGATATGEKFQMPIRYNGAADTASWNEMKSFFATIFK